MKRRCSRFFILGALSLSCTGSSWAGTALRYQDIEAVATSDVALYICAQAYPEGLAALKAKLDKNLRTLASPPAALRLAPAYRKLYDSQLNDMLTTPKTERQQFCQEASK